MRDIDGRLSVSWTSVVVSAVSVLHGSISVYADRQVKGGEEMYIVTITTCDCQTYVFNTSNLSETFKRLHAEDDKAGEILYLCGFEPMPNCNLIEELAHVKADEITSIVISKC